MSPDDETTPIDETTDQATVEEATTVGDTSDDGDTSDNESGEGVEAEGTLLEQSQAAIDDAHEAVQRVAATDAIGEDATGAGDLPPFADSAEGVEKPDPDDTHDA